VAVRVQAYVNARRASLGTLVGRDWMAGRRLAGDDRFETQIVVMASDSDAVSWLRLGAEAAPALLVRSASMRTGGCRSDLRRQCGCHQCGRPQRQVRHQGRRPTKALI